MWWSSNRSGVWNWHHKEARLKLTTQRWRPLCWRLKKMLLVWWCRWKRARWLRVRFIGCLQRKRQPCNHIRRPRRLSFAIERRSIGARVVCLIAAKTWWFPYHFAQGSVIGRFLLYSHSSLNKIGYSAFKFAGTDAEIIWSSACCQARHKQIVIYLPTKCTLQVYVDICRFSDIKMCRKQSP